MIKPVIQSIKPWVWTYAWPQDIKNELVSYTNPKGRLTINNIKLGGSVLLWMVLEYVAEDLRFKHIGSFCGNNSAVAWKYRGVTQTSIP